MACSLASFAPDCQNEAESWIVEQGPKACPTAIQVSSTPTEHVRSTQVQLSPISFLPNEILIEIFKYGVSEVPHSARALPLPVAVANVCKSWRALSLHAPELWKNVFVTSATPAERLRTYLERSGSFDINVSFCLWSAPRPAEEVNSSDAYLESIIVMLRPHAFRLRSLSLWGVTDTVVCTVIHGFLNIHTPRLTNVSIKANQTTYTHYYRSRNLFLLPFFSGRAPFLSHIDIDHFPIGAFRMHSGWPLDVQNLTSLILRTQEWPTQGYFLPPYLVEFTAFCMLLRSTPNLTTLALFGPVIGPDEDLEMRPPRVVLPALEALIIHRYNPGIRYHCELLGILYVPTLKRLEIPWHDDLTAELPYLNQTEEYLFDRKGQPRFASVKELYLHDSTARWKMPTRSFIKAFPDVEEVVLGGMDVAKFAATLRGFVYREDGDRASKGMLADGGWQRVRRVVLKEPEMAGWRGWIRGFIKWLAAGGHTGQVTVEIQDAMPREGELDERGVKAFKRGLDRLRKHAHVEIVA